jgi:phosphoribosylformylglycinamidine synthase
VVCVSAAGVAEVRARADAAGVAVTDLGTAGGGRVVLGRLVDVALDDVRHAWRDAIPLGVAGVL